MNGQPVKGSVLAGFSVVGFFSLLTIPAALTCWPFLEASESRTAIEAIFTVTGVVRAVDTVHLALERL